MKKLISLLMILTLGVGIHLQASEPIPSYNVLVKNTANFQEKNHQSDTPNSNMKGKRDMIIWAQVAGPSKTPVTISVYSLDMRDYLGPYILAGSGEISVPIDDRNWGTLVQCTDEWVVSVWTDDEGGPGVGVNENL